MYDREVYVDKFIKQFLTSFALAQFILYTAAFVEGVYNVILLFVGPVAGMENFSSVPTYTTE